jgi:hypothetical protein
MGVGSMTCNDCFYSRFWDSDILGACSKKHKKVKRTDKKCRFFMEDIKINKQGVSKNGCK